MVSWIPWTSLDSLNAGWGCGHLTTRFSPLYRRGAASSHVIMAAPVDARVDKGVNMLSILGWIIFGLIIGALAKLLMPGRDPGGIIVTIVLGIIGALLGGFLGRALGFYGPGEAAGFVMSLIGAMMLLLFYRLLVARRA
jgi:uncharacterized membrane protein YeaQ/YmgE (transglycosylase-associated protein family)